MEEQTPPNRPVAGSNPASPAICQRDDFAWESERGITGGALGLQPSEAGSIPVARSKESTPEFWGDAS